MSTLFARDLTVRLGGRTLLDRIDLALAPGQVTAIVGANGAGKSTLLACLAALRLPTSGDVRLDDQLLASLDGRKRARTIGYLAQTPEIAWRLDVHTFVQLGRTAHRGVFGESIRDAQAINAALDATRLTSLADRDVTTLSGGEQARALIARALAGEPDWLLADEPLSGLDPGHQLDAAELLQQFARNGGGVVVTLHDLSFAARTADRIIVIANGRVIADGSATEALSPDVLQRAYGLEARWLQGANGPLLDIVGKQG